MKIGIITIHRIYNYGSVLQTFAIQHFLQMRGHNCEIIDYLFPNNYHRRPHNESHNPINIRERIKRLFLKGMFAIPLKLQHRRTDRFVERYLNLSAKQYAAPSAFSSEDPQYDVYISGSDQIWNPRFCHGDPSFFLMFAPQNKLKIAYASSFGVTSLPAEYMDMYRKYLNTYDAIGVREESSLHIVHELLQKPVPAQYVLDPTFLLTAEEWTKILPAKRIISDKYILCYFLNYSFEAFPYIEKLAQHISSMTGYKIIRVGRPPINMRNPHTKFIVAASPEQFASLIKHAALVLTTSFHGTAWSALFHVPLFSVVESKMASDVRQIDLLKQLGMEDRILGLNDPYPTAEQLPFDYTAASERLQELRKSSIDFLLNVLENDSNKVM